MSAVAKVGQKSQKEIDKEREGYLSALHTVAKFYSAFVLANILLILICIARLEVKAVGYQTEGEKVIYLCYAIINVINTIAIILLWFGVFYAKEAFVYAYLLVNGIWIFVFLLLQVFILFNGQTVRAAGGLTIVIGICYGVFNIILELVVYFLIVTLQKYRNNVPLYDRAKFNILSKTGMTSDVPMAIGGKGGQTCDNSVTEITLKFNESVHK